MNMSFQEKSVWITLAGLVIAVCAYALSAAATIRPPGLASDLTLGQAWPFVSAMILMLVVQVVGHVAIAVMDRQPEPDERDRSIEAQASRYGAFALAAGVFVALCTALVTKGNAVMAHILLGSWLVAQAVETVARLVHYRRGG